MMSHFQCCHDNFEQDGDVFCLKELVPYVFSQRFAAEGFNFTMF